MSKIVTNYSVVFPSTAESPHADYHGIKHAGEFEILPVTYKARPLDEHMYVIELSGNGSITDENPRGLNRYSQYIPTHGYQSLNPMIQDLVDSQDMKVLEIHHFKGHHRMKYDFCHEAMPWNLPEDNIMGDWRLDQSLKDFIDYWHKKGLKIIAYCGTVVAPNFGTMEEPYHKWFEDKEEHWNHLREMVEYTLSFGFDGIGLDATNWLMSYREEPYWANNWKDTPAILPEKDSDSPKLKGITAKFLDFLHKNFPHTYMFTEAFLPYGKKLQHYPSLTLMNSKNNDSPAKGTRPTVDDLTRPVIEQLVNPGCELMMGIHGTNYTVEEIDEIKSKCKELGYHVWINYWVLNRLNLVTKSIWREGNKGPTLDEMYGPKIKPMPAPQPQPDPDPAPAPEKEEKIVVNNESESSVNTSANPEDKPESEVSDHDPFPVKDRLEEIAQRIRKIEEDFTSILAELN